MSRISVSKNLIFKDDISVYNSLTLKKKRVFGTYSIYDFC